MEVTIKIELQPEVLQFLKAIQNLVTAQMGGLPPTQTLDEAMTKIVEENDGGEVLADEAPAKPAARVRPSRAKPKPADMTPAADEAEDEAPEAESTASLDDIRQLIHTLINGGKRDEIKSLLNANGVERVTDLEESKWGNFFTELKSIENG